MHAKIVINTWTYDAKIYNTTYISKSENQQYINQYFFEIDFLLMQSLNCLKPYQNKN